MVSKFRGKYTPEFRDTAVRAVVDSSRPIADVARELGLVEQTLRNWVAAHLERTGGGEKSDDLTVSERARLKQLEKEVRELRMEKRVPGKSNGLLRQENPVTMKYGFIGSEEGNYPTSLMCRWAKVSTSGYYDGRPVTCRRRPGGGGNSAA